MVGERGRKRRHDGYNRRHDRKKFRRTTNATEQRKDLGYGLQGILFSCTPHHENQAYREAVIMLAKYCEKDEKRQPLSAIERPVQGEQRNEEENVSKVACEGQESLKADVVTIPKTEGETETKDVAHAEADGEPTAHQQAEPKGELCVEPKAALKADQNPSSMDVSKVLEEELHEIRDPEQKLFTRVDGGVNGSVFLRVNRPDVDIERVVESALREARSSGSPNARHCIRIMPIHTTCYAKPEDAAKAAVEVVKRHFPPPQSRDSPVTYAISFKYRLNTNVHREEYITAIAKAIDEHEPKYKVNLKMPDVTLIVEVLKTSCCIGTFRYFYQLAKMNLREAACPSKPKEDGNAKKNTAKDGVNDINQIPSGASAQMTGNESTRDETNKGTEAMQTNDRAVGGKQLAEENRVGGLRENPKAADLKDPPTSATTKDETEVKEPKLENVKTSKES